MFFDAARLPQETFGMQGLYASLELLPMWSGIESDVQLFASGRVLDDDGEWAGGQSLGEGSGSGSGVWEEVAVAAAFLAILLVTHNMDFLRTGHYEPKQSSHHGLEEYPK